MRYRNLSPRGKREFWENCEELGVISDQQLARKLKASVETVAMYRRKRSLPPVPKPKKKIDTTPRLTKKDLIRKKQERARATLVQSLGQGLEICLLFLSRRPARRRGPAMCPVCRSALKNSTCIYCGWYPRH